MSTQTQRIRDAEARYMESAQLVRELRAENEKLKASMKRLRARTKKKAPKLEHQIKRAINNAAKSLSQG